MPAACQPSSLPTNPLGPASPAIATGQLCLFYMPILPLELDHPALPYMPCLFTLRPALPYFTYLTYLFLARTYT